MAIFTMQELDDATEVVESMTYRALEEYDPWYPDIDELESKISGETKGDALFLMWLASPAGKLSEEQEIVRKHINKMLYRSEIVTIDDPEEGDF